MSQANDRWRRLDNEQRRTLDRYTEQLAQYPLIDKQEEARLARRIRAGSNEALEKLVNANLRFVITIAARYQYQGLELSDLVNAGNIGLIKAARKFDETRGFKFITYAVWWIRQSILYTLAQESRIVRIPLGRVGLKHKVDQTAQSLEKELRREATPEEVAKELNVPVDEIVEAMNIANAHLSLDATSFGEDGAFIEMFQDARVLDPEQLYERQQLQRVVQDLLDTLEERDAFVIIKYFGLDGKKAYTLDEIAQQFQPRLTRERVRQIKEKTLELLKKRMNTKNLLAALQMKQDVKDHPFY